MGSNVEQEGCCPQKSIFEPHFTTKTQQSAKNPGPNPEFLPQPVTLPPNSSFKASELRQEAQQLVQAKSWSTSLVVCAEVAESLALGRSWGDSEDTVGNIAGTTMEYTYTYTYVYNCVYKYIYIYILYTYIYAICISSVTK